MNNYAILGYPRSGTKLLAEIYKQQGFHIYGEFFDSFSSKVVGASAVRRSIHHQLKIQEKIRPGADGRYVAYHSRIVRRRIELFGKCQRDNSVVTVWQDNFDFAPELMLVLQDRKFLCITRPNEFEHLLSRITTSVYKNYNGETESAPFVADPVLFQNYFHRLRRAKQLQKWIVSSNKGVFVNFDKLIAGEEDLGFKYTVSTTDQHTDLHSVITNIEEITQLYNDLNARYRRADG